jgi:hypothetical protein
MSNAISLTSQRPGEPGFTLRWALGPAAADRTDESGLVFSPDGLTYQAGNLRLCATLPPWSTLHHVETAADGPRASFVLLFGAAHWKGRQDSWLSAADLTTFLECHRAGQPPPVLNTDGNYCAVSYDHVSDSVWVATDFWATAGFYYGHGVGYAVVSSRAAAVADLIGSPVDVTTYLALLRGAVFPAGSTLFRDVSRISMGEALRLAPLARDVAPTTLAPLYREPDHGSFRDSVERSVTALRRVVPFTGTRPATVVDFTAGNDTRLLAAALAGRTDVTRDLTFRVVGPPTSPDVAISTRLAGRLGWRHRACAQETGVLTADALVDIAVAADGSFSLESIANRLAFEERQWPDARHLIGGTAGELFRNWIWQPELLRMGRTPSINYDALLRHRVPRDRSVDVSRITTGRLDQRMHDQLLLAPLRKLDARLPSVLNVYKLDLYYIQGLMHRVLWWAIAPRIITILPFLWTDLTDVSLRLPWRHKMTRRLVTSVVERLHPGLAEEPTDRGAPFRRLRPGTAVAYTRYLSSYVSNVVRRHYLSRVPRPILVASRPPAIPSEWAKLLTRPAASPLHDCKGLLERVRSGRGDDLSSTERREFLTMLQVQLLFEHYPGIRRELAVS